MREKILKYIIENRQSIITLSVCILIGVLLGAISFNFISQEDKISLIDNIKKTLELSKKEGFKGLDILKNATYTNIGLVLIIFLSSTMVIAPAIICIIYFLKGFAIGIYTVLIFNVFGIGNGLLVLLLSILLPNIIYMPAFIYLGVSAINFHYDIIKRDNSKSKMGILMKFSYQILSIMPFYILSVIIENLTSSTIIGIYKNIK